MQTSLGSILTALPYRLMQALELFAVMSTNAMSETGGYMNQETKHLSAYEMFW